MLLHAVDEIKRVLAGHGLLALAERTASERIDLGHWLHRPVAEYEEMLDDFLPKHRGPGRPPKITDAELICLALAQIFLDCPKERRFLRFAKRRLGHLFPYIPGQSGYTSASGAWRPRSEPSPFPAIPATRRSSRSPSPSRGGTAGSLTCCYAWHLAPTSPGSGSPPAIVVGLDCITGLQTARILAERGVRVIGIAGDPRHFACRTRACERVVVADAKNTALDIDGRTLIDALGSLAAAGDRGVLVPCTDASVLLLARHRERLEPGHIVPLPDYRTVETLSDKAAFFEHAQREALPIPRTVVLNDRRDATSAASQLRFPCILKPRVKTAAWERNRLRKAYKILADDDLLDVYDRVAPWVDVLVAQEWIEGEDSDLYSCYVYFDRDARPLVTFVARKIRQWPLETGDSAIGVECRNDEVLRETLRLFEGVGFHGLGHLEMKRHARTGEHLITEPNVGRPTARSAIAEAGGVELLYTAYCDAAGLGLPGARQQRYGGAKWVYLRRDLRSALAYRRQGKLGLREWLRSWRGRKAYAVFSITDPLPFLIDLLQTAARLLTRLRPGGSPPHSNKIQPVVRGRPSGGR